MKEKGRIRGGYTLLTLACVVLLGMVTAAAAAPPSWNAFDTAQFEGIYITPSLVSGVLSYELEIGPNAKVIVGTAAHDIGSIQDFYIVSQDSNTAFTATDGSNSMGWSWGTKNLPRRGGPVVAGWAGTGNNQLHPGDKMTFSFGSLGITGNAVLAGFSVKYGDHMSGGGCGGMGMGGMGGGGMDDASHWVKGCVQPVPEPSSIFALISGIAGMGTLVWRRRK